MIEKNLLDITYKDIQDLIENSISESKTLDYKLQFPQNLNDSEKKELLADISSFTNTLGWDLIFGIKEKEWVAKEIIWCDIENLDNWKLKLESIIRTGIEPRINYEIKEIKLDDLKYIIILRIKESFIKPHWISYQNNHKFYLRSSTWKYESELSELKDLFLSTDQISNKINAFKLKRLNTIEINDSYMQFNDGLKIIIHIVPINSQQIINLFDDKGLNSSFPPIYASGRNHRVNIDGFLTYSPNGNSYTQIYKNWSIEVVRSQNNSDKIYYTWYEEEIINYIKQCLENLTKIWMSYPFYLSLCFLDISWYSLKRSNFHSLEHWYSYDKNLLDTWNVIINNIDNIEKKIKPLFDVIWNAFWYIHSRNYDKNWNWTWSG